MEVTMQRGRHCRVRGEALQKSRQQLCNGLFSTPQCAVSSGGSLVSLQTIHVFCKLGLCLEG